jgi:hypothetical protein
VIPLSRAELSSFKKHVVKVLKANGGHSALTAAYQAIQSLLDRATEAAELIKSRPGKGQPAAIVALMLHRLNAGGASPMELLATTAAICLYDQWRPFRTNLVRMCAIANALASAKQLGPELRKDPRYAFRFNNNSQAARVQLASYFVNIVGSVLPLIERAVEGALAVREKRTEAALEKLRQGQQEELKLPQVKRPSDKKLLSQMPPPAAPAPAENSSAPTAPRITRTLMPDGKTVKVERLLGDGQTIMTTYEPSNQRKAQ